MSLHPQVGYLVPDETARVARAAFPRGNNLAMLMRDHLGMIFDDQQFADLFSPTGQPAASPFRLALTTVLQFVEGVSDRQAADAVRSRIDWKFALALPLEDPGFDASVLSEFRTRLLAGQAEHRLFDTLLTLLRDQGLLKAQRRQRTDSTHVLAAVRGINRLELVRDTLQGALEQLAGEAPTWLQHHVPAAWGVRYQPHFNDRLPKGDTAQRTFAVEIGRDGFHLLGVVFADEAMRWLRELPAVEILRQVWVQNYVRTSDGTVTWRTAEGEGLPPSARFLSSPHDVEARYSRKNTTSWIGYKVHLTETCVSDAPNLITHVETTPATTADGAVTPKVHAALQAKGLLPKMHLVDTGYLDAELLVQSREQYGVDLLGPTRHDQRWQARAAAGFGLEHFAIDWERECATCPGGKTSVEWVPRVDVRGNANIYIRVSPADCGPCPLRAQCTRSQAKHPRRSIAVRPREQYEALQARRAYEREPDFAREYGKRAGIEGTISEGIRSCGMRRSRYVGERKTHQQHVFTATALNFVRTAHWLAGHPRAKTRRSRFAALFPQVA
jgi:transposase